MKTHILCPKMIRRNITIQKRTSRIQLHKEEIKYINLYRGQEMIYRDGLLQNPGGDYEFVSDLDNFDVIKQANKIKNLTNAKARKLISQKTTLKFNEPLAVLEIITLTFNA